MSEKDGQSTDNVTYRSTTTPFRLQEHVRRSTHDSVYSLTVSDDKKAGHWTGVFGHSYGTDRKRGVDTVEGMSGRGCILILEELTDREEPEGRFGRGVEACAVGREAD